MQDLLGRRWKDFAGLARSLFRKQVHFHGLVDRELKSVSTQVAKLKSERQALEETVCQLAADLRALQDQMSRLSSGESTRPAIYLGDGLVLTKTVHGHKMYLPAGDRGVTPCLLLDGYWEPDATAALHELVRPGMSIIEIGGNVGWYTVLLAQWVGPQGRLLTFEANPRLAQILELNLRANSYDWGRIEARAVMDRTTEAAFHATSHNMAAGSLMPTIQEWAKGADDEAVSITVPGVSLDDYVQEHPEWQKVDLVRVDAEGAEYLVLKGMTRLSESNPKMKLILEFGPQMIPVFAGNIREFFNAVKAAGFRKFTVISETPARPITVEELIALEGSPVVLDLVCERS